MYTHICICIYTYTCIYDMWTIGTHGHVGYVIVWEPCEGVLE